MTVFIHGFGHGPRAHIVLDVHVDLGRPLEFGRSGGVAEIDMKGLYALPGCIVNDVNVNVLEDVIWIGLMHVVEALLLQQASNCCCQMGHSL